MAIVSPRQHRRALLAQERDEWKVVLRDAWPYRDNVFYRMAIKVALLNLRRPYQTNLPV